ncbi:hypothetical protein HDV01_007208 [Terramyces sp. JEL0728]|nr:hypothetical protein HDV01_007208 [Terramyces sp. JEL0728]
MQLEHNPPTIALISFILGSMSSYAVFTQFPLIQYLGLLSMFSCFDYIANAITDSVTISDFLSPLITTNSHLFFASFIEIWFNYRRYIPSIIPILGLILTIAFKEFRFVAQMEPFLKQKPILDIFKQIRVYFPHFPLSRLIFYCWLAALQIALCNFLTLLLVLYSFKLEYDLALKNKVLENIGIADGDFKGFMGLPVLDGKHVPQNIAFYGYNLGMVCGVGLGLQGSFVYKFGLFLVFLSTFHLLEYYTLALHQPVTLESFLINHSREYHMAMGGACLEYFVELFLFPAMKQWSFTNIGIVAVILAQALRSSAMVHARSNFTHQIEFEKKDTHLLVTDGIYKYFRHPSYTGFFYWGLSMQLILANPVSFALYWLALYKFFKERIQVEEQSLEEFFDKYKAYKKTAGMVAYGEFRKPYEKDTKDQRLVYYGTRYIIENYIAKQYTVEDVEQAALFFKQHNAGATEFPFPKDLFLKFVKENNGYFPVKIQALPEGSVIYPHVPVYQITAEGEYARCKTIIEQAYADSVDESGYWSLGSRLHDFGFRGCTSVEQSIIGGTAHLLNFEGTDTLSACWYAQFKLNNGKPVGYSIPATEHSIMTAHVNEKRAMTKLLEEFGSGVCACVMDSYDYTNALEAVLPSVASLKVNKGGFLVLRPDSGDPVQVILQALCAADTIFGSDVNQKGYKVLRGVGVIQGDGINIQTLKEIAEAVKNAGYAAQNVAYGMGGGLLQKVNRDTMSFATKLCKIIYADGISRNVMKMPKDDPGKRSIPGETHVVREDNQLPVVYPVEAAPSLPNELQVVYDHGKVCKWDDFETVRNRITTQWKNCPRVHNPISKELNDKMKRVESAQRAVVDSEDV